MARLSSITRTVCAAAVARALAGTYYLDELDATWILAVRDGRLTAQALGDPPSGLTVVNPGVFVSDEDLVLRFERDGGAAARASVRAGRVTDLVFARR
jgi:hypothetical protein